MQYVRYGVEALDGDGKSTAAADDEPWGQWIKLRLTGSGSGGRGGGTAPPYEPTARASVNVVMRVEDILVDEVQCCTASIDHGDDEKTKKRMGKTHSS